MSERSTILDLWAAGAPAGKIAQEVGRSVGVVRGVVRRARAKGDFRAAARPIRVRVKPTIPVARPQWAAIVIVESECRVAGVDLAVLKQDLRRACFVETRRRIAKRLRNDLNLSFARIGHLLDRDHSTVRNLIQPRPRSEARQ